MVMPERGASQPGSNGPAQLDRLVHEPARLSVLLLLHSLDEADFLFLQRETGLTQGNLSSHLATLEEAGYLRARKEFVGKRPRTLLSLTARGRVALRRYAKRMGAILGDLA